MKISLKDLVCKSPSQVSLNKSYIFPDVDKMFQQQMANQKTKDALRLTWRSNKDQNFQDIPMNQCSHVWKS